MALAHPETLICDVPLRYPESPDDDETVTEQAKPKSYPVPPPRTLDLRTLRRANRRRHCMGTAARTSYGPHSGTGMVGKNFQKGKRANYAGKWFSQPKSGVTLSWQGRKAGSSWGLAHALKQGAINFCPYPHPDGDPGGPMSGRIWR